jgi:hypothetical protein
LSDLQAAVEELYGLEPVSFTARRDAIAATARRDGDRDLANAVKALRRPSAAAHAVNMLARSSPDELAQLVALGEKLRVAQESLSGDDLRALGKQRSRLVTQMARRAAALSESALSDAALREVAGTLEAAMGDPAASAAVQSGNLVRAFARAGLDAVDLDGAVAGGGPPSPRPRRSGEAAPAEAAPAEAAATQAAATQAAVTQAAVAAARRGRDRTAERLGEARRAAEEARHALAGATAARDQADARVEELVGELAEARRVADGAAEQQRRARRAVADATSDTDTAAEALERAEAALGEAEGDGG